MPRDDGELLEKCLTECKRRLDHFREIRDELQAALTQADMDDILENLAVIYRVRQGRAKRERTK